MKKKLTGTIPADLASPGVPAQANESAPGSSPLYLSLYCYPWDVLDEGPAAFAELTRATGLNHINMASSYHGGKAFLPHNSRSRVYYIEDGVVYFPPSPQFFGATKIQPRVSRWSAGYDPYIGIVEACEKEGVGVTAWTVFIHNSHLGTTYPEYTTQNAFGDHYFHALCPSQPAVQEYMRALAGNLASYPISAVEFECFEFISFRHYSFLEKEGTGVTPFAEMMLSLCFCPACTEAAKQRGVNGAAVEKAVRGWLEEYFEGKHRFGGAVASKVSSVSGLDDYLEMRFAVLENLFKDVVGILHARDKKAYLIIIGQEERRHYLSGIDLQSMGQVADAVTALFYARKLEEASEIVRGIRRAAGANTAVHFAVRPGFPDAASPADVLRLTEASLKAGVNGIGYYNFGLLEKFHMDWVRKAVASITRGATRGRQPAKKATHRGKPGSDPYIAVNVLRTDRD